VISVNNLEVRPDAGSIVENAVFIQLKMSQVDSIRYWRTLAKAEVDFILESGKGLVPIEVKYSLSKILRISRGFRNFLWQYQPDRALVLTKNSWGELKVGSSLVKFVPVWYL